MLIFRNLSKTLSIIRAFGFISIDFHPVKMKLQQREASHLQANLVLSLVPQLRNLSQ